MEPLPWAAHRLDLGGGEALLLQVAEGPGDRVVLLFHGLGGDAGRDYMARAASRFHALGASVVAVNHRGAGAGRGLARQPYHSGATADLEAVFRYGRERFPGRRQLAIGYSLSGNILLLLLGRHRTGRDLPDAAIAVNPPADLEHCSRLLGRGLNRLYDLRFVRLLRTDLDHRRALGLEAAEIPAFASLRDFDESFTARAAGFRDRADYYARCACGPHLQGIEVPTVVLSSEDDPFAPAADLRRSGRSPQVHLHVEPRGGHMGYLSLGYPRFRWLEAALEYFSNKLL